MTPIHLLLIETALSDLSYTDKRRPSLPKGVIITTKSNTLIL